eukprot:6921430-Pyramimonas_sp.AAC.1
MSGGFADESRRPPQLLDEVDDLGGQRHVVNLLVDCILRTTEDRLSLGREHQKTRKQILAVWLARVHLGPQLVDLLLARRARVA